MATKKVTIQTDSSIPAVGTQLRLMPDQIIVDPAVQSRFSLTGVVDDKHVRMLADSMLRKGQENPVTVFFDPRDSRKDAQGRPMPHLAAGKHRHAACALNNRERPDTPMPLWCVVIDVTDAKQAFLRNFEDNLERKDLTPMDTYNVIRRLLDWGWKKADIAAKFRQSSESWVNYMTKLGSLPESLQIAVHEGLIVGAAIGVLPELGRIGNETVRNDAAARALSMAQAEADSRLKGKAIETLYGNRQNITIADLSTALATVVKEISDDTPRLFDPTLKDGLLGGKYRNVNRINVRSLVKDGSKTTYATLRIFVVAENITADIREYSIPLADIPGVVPGMKLSLVGLGESTPDGTSFKLSAPLAYTVPMPKKDPEPRLSEGPDSTTPDETEKENGNGTNTAVAAKKTANDTQQDKEDVASPVRTVRELKAVLGQVGAKFGSGHPATVLAATIVSFLSVRATDETAVIKGFEALADYISAERQAEMIKTVRGKVA